MACPSLPFLPHFDDHDEALRSLQRPDRVLSRIGIGFRILKTLVPDSEAQPLQTVVERLAFYTLAVEDYVTGSPYSQSLAVLADQRNLCQHGLLSLIPKSAVSDRPASLVQALRIAATIYSFLVVFPISGIPFKELGQSIRSASTSPAFSKAFKEAPELVVWITVMGAIAAIGTDDRAAFVPVLDRCLRKLRIDTWEALKSLLGKFLWLPGTNDGDGYDLWLEIEESSPFQLGDSSATRTVSSSPDGDLT